MAPFYGQIMDDIKLVLGIEPSWHRYGQIVDRHKISVTNP
jgi:hypothetical protein